MYYGEIFGSREDKYSYLTQNSMRNVTWKEVTPIPPYYFLKPKNLSNAEEYERGVKLSELFPVYIGGVKTHDDSGLVSRERFDSQFDQFYDYRPFDIQHIDYDLSRVVRHRNEVMRHFVGHENLGLVINRQVVTDNWSHVQIVRNMIDNRLHYSRKGIPCECPMYLYEGNSRTPNVDVSLVSMFEEYTGMRFTPEKTNNADEFSIINLFDYCYAILFSEQYRLKYHDLLCIDFPRVPYPRDREQFQQYCDHGAELRKLHLLETDVPNLLNIKFEGIGNNEVTSVSYSNETIKINRTQRFTGVSETVWDFCFGGYHGLQKWFKDRRGCILTEEDISHVIKVLNVFSRTAEVMEKIDLIACD